MHWFPLSSCSCPSKPLTATPNRSLSGSVPMTMSALVCSPKAKAIAKASGSSGFGELTVGKLPSGSACALTIFTVYPAFSSTAGMAVMEVPWSEVNTMFNAFLLGALKFAWAQL